MHGYFMYIFSFLCKRKRSVQGEAKPKYFVKFRNVIIHTKNRAIIHRNSRLQSAQIGRLPQEKNSCVNFDISSGHFLGIRYNQNCSV